MRHTQHSHPPKTPGLFSAPGICALAKLTVASWLCRFKDGEQKVVDTEKQIAGKVKKGVRKAGRTAEHDYDRYSWLSESFKVLLHKGSMRRASDLLECLGKVC